MGNGYVHITFENTVTGNRCMVPYEKKRVSKKAVEDPWKLLVDMSDDYLMIACMSLGLKGDVSEKENIKVVEIQST